MIFEVFDYRFLLKHLNQYVMRANRNRTSNGTHRDEPGRFTSNEGYSNRNNKRSYRDDRSYSNGYSNADAERYPISRSYDDFDDEQFNQSNYSRGDDHREWDNRGFSQFDRSDNDDFRSRNQRSGGNTGMYGRGTMMIFVHKTEDHPETMVRITTGVTTII
jgi:hypothetical protein